MQRGPRRAGVQDTDVGEPCEAARAMGSCSLKIRFLVDNSGGSGEAAVRRPTSKGTERQEACWGRSLPPSSVLFTFPVQDVPFFMSFEEGMSLSSTCLLD